MFAGDGKTAGAAFGFVQGGGKRVEIDEYLLGLADGGTGSLFLGEIVEDALAQGDKRVDGTDEDGGGEQYTLAAFAYSSLFGSRAQRSLGSRGNGRRNTGFIRRGRYLWNGNIEHARFSVLDKYVPILKFFSPVQVVDPRAAKVALFVPEKLAREGFA